MRALLYKQFHLVCHPMTLVFCLFGAMLLIPNYPYTVAFFYVTLGIFFTFMNIREQRDMYYAAVLPIRKRDTVKASVLFIAMIELASLVIAVPFAVLSVHINPNGGNIVGMDPNVTLFGAALLLYALFNAIFLCEFYRTAYKVGMSYLKAVIPMAIGMMVCEALVHFPGMAWLDAVDAAGQMKQLPILLLGLVVYVVGLLLTYRCAAGRYEKVDL